MNRLKQILVEYSSQLKIIQATQEFHLKSCKSDVSNRIDHIQKRQSEIMTKANTILQSLIHHTQPPITEAERKWFKELESWNLYFHQELSKTTQKVDSLFTFQNSFVVDFSKGNVYESNSNPFSCWIKISWFFSNSTCLCFFRFRI